uniref:Uncharacterized protein n=1 Tax=Listeria ivanovii TaxID=1638 RepID=A0A7T0MB58_LISIV|nr:hypothetical protein pLIS600236c [Listeria ivanovii]
MVISEFSCKWMKKETFYKKSVNRGKNSCKKECKKGVFKAFFLSF